MHVKMYSQILIHEATQYSVIYITGQLGDKSWREASAGLEDP